MLLLVTWPCFPLPSAICGFIWIAGRVLYMLGYARSPKLRLWGAIGYIGLLGLLGLAVASAAFFYQRRDLSSSLRPAERGGRGACGWW